MTLYAAQRVTRFSHAAAIVLLLLPLGVTGRALLTGGVYGPLDLAYTVDPLASTPQAAHVPHVVNPELSDVYTEFFPWNDAMRRSIARGEWPLWNPYELCGTPLAGAAQVAPYHPITVTGLLIPLAKYFAFAAAMLHLLAALAAFLFFRDLVESEMAALFGAAAWTLSTYIIFFAGTALGNAVSVMPLVLLGSRRIVREPGPRSAALLAVALLLVVLSGHPESALHVVSLGVAWFIFELVAFRPKNVRRVIASGLAAGVGTLLLSAIFLLPHIAVIGESAEYLERWHAYDQKSATAAQMAHRLVANFFPFLEGSPGVEEPVHEKSVAHGWLATCYSGSVVLATAVFGLIVSRLRERWFFAGMIVFGLGAGISAPVIADLLRVLPGFSIAVNDRMISFAALGMCALGALALDAFIREPGRAFSITLVGIAGLFVFAAAAIPSDVDNDYLRLGLARAVIPLLLSAAALTMLRGQTAAAALITLLLIQRLGEAGRLQATLPAEAFYPSFPGLELMRSPQPFRIVAAGSLLPPAISTHYGLEDPRGFQAVTFARYDATIPLWSVRQPVWSNRVDNLAAPFLSLANVRYALAPSRHAADGWITRRELAAYAVLENSRALPRAFVPRTVHLVTSKAASLQGVSTGRDFSAESWIEGDRQGTSTNGPGSVSVEGQGHRLRLFARMAGAGWIVVSNAAWSGWHATMNGRELPIRFANHTFLAFHLPQGEHEITLLYRPRAFVIGAWISAITAAVMFTLLIFARMRR